MLLSALAGAKGTRDIKQDQKHIIIYAANEVTNNLYAKI
jgi:hypothetical protein